MEVLWDPPTRMPAASSALREMLRIHVGTGPCAPVLFAANKRLSPVICSAAVERRDPTHSWLNRRADLL